ncbi:peroxidase family protein [Algirhabdus cladophorae]|uniref:peroxidase family protein n=1 Tax=Algirhabdus cladophorae TaxID=3377108 RepID=UPI003B84B1FB
MLFSLGHGQHIILPKDGETESNIIPDATKRVSAVAPGANLSGVAKSGVEAGLSGSDAQSFGYMFPDADGTPGDDPATVNALKALADAMTEAAGDPAGANGDHAPIFTYFGQFIDHDITANTDRDAPQPNPISEMTGAIVPPLDRADVVSNIVNLRNGSLRLDSLYGNGPTDTPFTIKVRAALRDPADQAKMRLGTVAPSPGDLIPLPADGMADLPRLGEMIDDPASGLSEADIDALPDGEFKEGLKKDGQVNRARAMIGDGRNDENLLVAQLHLAFLRFHNAVATSLEGSIADADDRFVEAQRVTTLIYQWLVVNVYLPKMCQPSVVDGVKAAGAPLYKAFRARVASSAAELPLPLEFSVSAFRFGHSMVRAEYDHNSNFGRPGTFKPRASFLDLFSFTGGDNLGMTSIGQSFDRLPSNWVIDWSRFAKDAPDEGDHRARRIDTKLAPPLTDMFKESSAGGDLQRILRHLAERNLRRGHRLNIPTGQGAVAAINAFDAGEGAAIETAIYQVAYNDDVPDMPAPEVQEGLEVLSEAALNIGPAGQALQDGNMLSATPLWFYLLREAEASAGDTLGPLGSRIVAETLIGLVIEDAASYWHEGAGDGSWTPAQTPVGGAAITDMPALLKAAGLMA